MAGAAAGPLAAAAAAAAGRWPRRPAGSGAGGARRARRTWLLSVRREKRARARERMGVGKARASEGAKKERRVRRAKAAEVPRLSQADRTKLDAPRLVRDDSVSPFVRTLLTRLGDGFGLHASSRHVLARRARQAGPGKGNERGGRSREATKRLRPLPSSDRWPWLTGRLCSRTRRSSQGRTGPAKGSRLESTAARRLLARSSLHCC